MGKKTQIVFVLDRSGSMLSVAEDAVGGFNAFLAEQQKAPQGKRFTLIQFDHEYRVDYDKVKLGEVRPLVNGQSYVPRGCTALMDAVARALAIVSDTDRAIVAVYTDGRENASIEVTKDALKKLIKQAQKRGVEVLFLASDVKPEYITSMTGLQRSKIASVDKGDMVATMTVASGRATAYATSGAGMARGLQEDYDNITDTD